MTEINEVKKTDTNRNITKGINGKRQVDQNEKQFIERPSVLTKLFTTDSNMKSLRHLSWAVVSVALLDSLLRSHRGLAIVKAGFKGTSTFVLLWTAMFSFALLGHLLVGKGLKTLRLCWYTLLMVGGDVAILLVGDAIGIGWRFALLFEQVRLFMKVHSYWQRNSKDLEPLPPTFQRFWYFLFAPTLLYRSKYPRMTGPIRWNLAVEHAVEFFGGVFLTAFNLEAFFGPLVEAPFAERGTLCWRTFGAATVPALCQLGVGNYLLLHSWQNAWAEILRFADRQFYTEWWSAVGYTEYYRRWNGIVHDWLRENVYAQVQRQGVPRASAALAVFAVSAFVHEYIIGLALGFCYPVMFVEFAGLGVVLGFIKPKGNVAPSFGNVFLWLTLSTGMAMQMILYAAEMRARIVCPPYSNPWLDPFVPRSLFCDIY